MNPNSIEQQITGRPFKRPSAVRMASFMSKLVLRFFQALRVGPRVGEMQRIVRGEVGVELGVHGSSSSSISRRRREPRRK